MFKSPRDIWFVDTLLRELEAKLELANRIGLDVLIEEVEAVARVDEIAACCHRRALLGLRRSRRLPQRSILGILTRLQRQMGHPPQPDRDRQRVFSPTEQEVGQARAVIDAVREAEAAGASAARLGGFMIDAATARVFQVTLDRQAQIDAKEPR